MRRRRAFTLLEVMLALFLLVIILGMMFQFYFYALQRRERGNAAVNEAYLARLLLRQISDEIRSSAGFVPGFGPGIVGDRYSITVQTHAVPSKDLFERRSLRDDALPGQHDIKQVRYFIAWDEEITDENGVPLALGLVRQELKTLRQTSIRSGSSRISDGIDSEFEDDAEVEDAEQSFRLQLYAPEIKLLEFRYFDGGQWHEDWTAMQMGDNSALPQMVRVTVGYETIEQEEFEELALEEVDIDLEGEQEPLPPRSYTAFVRCFEADSFFQSRVTRAASTLAAEGGL